jgi:hypothetical protein
MNIALLTKWIWRLFDSSEQDNLWFKLLQAKYVNSGNIFATATQGGSQFWRSLNKSNIFSSLVPILWWEMVGKLSSGLIAGWESPH